MADIHIDIERMIMHSNYLLEVDNSSASNGLSDMERKQYLDQIKELVQTGLNLKVQKPKDLIR